MLIDAHAHVNFNAYKDDASEVIRRALDNDIWMINIGSQSSTSERAVKIAEQYPEGVYTCVGLHPMHLFSAEVDEQEVGAHFKTREEGFDHDLYYQLGQHPKTVGIGETGLDYYYLSSQSTVHSLQLVKSKQKEVFVKHIHLAGELSLPLMLHCRGSKEDSEDAYRDMLEILKNPPQPPFSKGGGADDSLPFKKGEPERDLCKGRAREGFRGMIHCFGSTLEIAQKFVALGFCVGFTGIATFPNAQNLQQIAQILPLESIIIETDCPYLAPQPVRGKRNEPLYVKYVAEKIADLKKESVQTISIETFNNTLRVFNKIKAPTS